MKSKLILLGGVPGVGKTTIAYQLALKFGIDKVISTDTIKMFLKCMFPLKDCPYLFTTTYDAYKIEKLSLINGYLKHCKIINEYLIKMLESSNDLIMIVEGATINNDFIAALNYDKYDILFINFMLDRKELIKRYKMKEQIRKSNWIENINNIMMLNQYLVSNSTYNINNKKLKKTVNEVEVLINENLYNQ